MNLLIADRTDGPLSALGEHLRDRFDWAVTCVDTGQACLQQLELVRWDAVITVGSLTDVDGIGLLAMARANQPATIRLLVDRPDTARLDLVHRAELAHRVLDAPPSAATVRAILTALEATPPGLSPRLQHVIDRIATSVPVQDVLLDLRRVIDLPGSTALDVALVVAQDPAVAHATLSLAAQTWGTPERPLQTLLDVADVLDASGLHQLATAACAFLALDATTVDPTLLSLTRRRGIAAVRRAAAVQDLPADIRTGSVLLDIGLPLLALAWPAEHAELRSVAAAHGQPLHELERTVLGATHAEAGAVLARRWALPPQLCRLIARHHLTPLPDDPPGRSAGFHLDRAVTAAVEALPTPARSAAPVGPPGRSRGAGHRVPLATAGLVRSVA